MNKILMLDNGQPFNFETPYESPLGGSETSFLLLSKGLAELNNSVVILSSSTVNVPQQDYNRLLHNINNIGGILPESDIIICNRCLPMEVLQSDKRIFYYSHDAFDQTHILQWMIEPIIVNRIEKILCVSEWQKNTFKKYYNIPEKKLFVLGNSIDSSLYWGFKQRNLNKLIFASIPYKGIDVLHEIFSDICIKSERDNLELHIYSSMELYGDTSGDEEYADSFSKLSRTNGIILHKPTSMANLAAELLSSNLYIHPCTYHESFGMLTVQSQAAGCLPVTIDNGANIELVDNNKTGFITKGKTIYHNDCYNEYINKIVDLLTLTKKEDELYKLRLEAQKSASKYNYIEIAKKLINLF